MKIDDYHITERLAETLSPMIIANRGVCLARIAKTMSRCQVSCVAIYEKYYSSQLISMIDHLVDLDHIERNVQAHDIYTNIDWWIKLSKKYQAKSIHPGWGFLSENYQFYQACEHNNLIVIGSSSNHIKNFGDKLATNKLVQKLTNHLSTKTRLNNYRSGSSLKHIGYRYPIDNNLITQHAQDIGYPLLIKGISCGGGRAIDLISHPSELIEGFKRCSNQALKLSQDSRVIIEKYKKNARHIECQIIADKYRSCMVAGTRECSVQRNYQKIIEEAPGALAISSDVIQALCEESIKLINSTNYYGLATIEFLVYQDCLSQNQNQAYRYQFIEVNPRLQVEHGISENIFEIDLVFCQMAISANLSVSEIFKLYPTKVVDRFLSTKLYSIEARICAETVDQSQRFYPYSGEYSLLLFNPFGLNLCDSDDHIRLEQSLRSVHGVISDKYDSLVAKLMVSSGSRSQAVNLLKKAIGHYVFVPKEHNLGLINQIISSHNFNNHYITTDYIATNLGNLVKRIDLCQDKNDFSMMELFYFIVKYIVDFDQFSLFRKIINRDYYHQDNSSNNYRSSVVNLIDKNSQENSPFPTISLDPFLGTLHIQTSEKKSNINGFFSRQDYLCLDIIYRLCGFHLTINSSFLTHNSKLQVSDKFKFYLNGFISRDQNIVGEDHIDKITKNKFLVICGISRLVISKLKDLKSYVKDNISTKNLTNQDQNFVSNDLIYIGFTGVYCDVTNTLTQINYFYQDSAPNKGFVSSIAHNHLISSYLEKSSGCWDKTVMKPCENQAIFDSSEVNFSDGKKPDQNSNNPKNKISEDHKFLHGDIISPISGVMTTIAVTEGEYIKKDQLIAVVEAMKMEIEITSPYQGEVIKINILNNKPVKKNQIIAVIKTIN